MDVRLEPGGDGWEALIRGWWSAGEADRAESRRGVGLPTDRPVVMTGHQAEMWHPGILAKLIAGQEAARRVGGGVGWLIADQDDNEALAVSIPFRDGRGVLRSERVRLGGEGGGAGVPTGARDAVRGVEAEHRGEPAAGSVERGLEAIVSALREASGEASLARQVAAALGVLSARWLERAPRVFASELWRAPAFGELLERMREDPRAAVEAYNAAAGESMEAGVAPLEIGAGRVELPLWRVRKGEARERVYADELEEVEGDELAPRALLMTAIVRLALCDLFIHGTGGAAYDRVTERWVERWLGRRLAPAVMATADVRLPLEEAAVSEADVAAAKWRAHHASHHPAVVGLVDLEEERGDFVERIEAARRAGEDPAPAFRSMHDLLARYRADQREALDGLEREASRLEMALASREVARERAWAFALHEAGAIDALRDEIARRLGTREARPCAC